MISYTKQDLARVLKTTISTINADNRCLANKNLIHPETEKGGQNKYSEADLKMFQQLREHCEEGYNRKSFVPKVIAENVSTTQKIAKDSSSMSQNSNAEQIALLQESDPFFEIQICQKLQEIADNRWLIPTKFMSLLLQKSPSTLRQYQEYNYWGFTILQNDKTINKMKCGTEIIGKEKQAILWRVDANNS